MLAGPPVRQAPLSVTTVCSPDTLSPVWPGRYPAVLLFLLERVGVGGRDHGVNDLPEAGRCLLKREHFTVAEQDAAWPCGTCGSRQAMDTARGEAMDFSAQLDDLQKRAAEAKVDRLDQRVGQPVLERGVDLVSDRGDAFGQVDEGRDSAATGPGQPAPGTAP